MSPWRRLAAFSYGVGSKAFHSLYDRGIRKALRLPFPVISVGNISMGGTGKTPMVHLLCQEALTRGLKPAVLTRGYGGRFSGVLLGGQVDGVAAGAEAYGDEAVMLSRALPEVPVVVGPKRFAEAQAFLRAGGRCDVFILDDGFQHRRLHRDVDLVLLGSEHPILTDNYFPLGTLRESVNALSRATCILTFGSSREVESLKAPSYRAKVHPDSIRVLGSIEGGVEPEEELKGKFIWGVSGIANPNRFRKSLEACGAEVVGWSTYPDHHYFTDEQIKKEEREATAACALLVTTAKDAVRMEGLASATWRVLDLKIEMGDQREAFLESIFGSLKQQCSREPEARG